MKGSIFKISLFGFAGFQEEEEVFGAIAFVAKKTGRAKIIPLDSSFALNTDGKNALQNPISLFLSAEAGRD